MASHKSDINVGIKFNADTQQARQQLQQLQNQLNNLISSTAKNTQMPLNKSLKEALNAAAQLKVALQAATNVDTGNLDLSKFSAQLKQSGTQLKDYAQHFINLGPEGEKAFMDLTKSIVTAEVPLKRSVKLFDEMWTTMKNTARWEISSRVLHGFESALSNAYRYAQDLNKSLTDIRIVTGYGADRMADFAIEANKAAKALSTTTNEYTKASLIYFQQGLSDQEVQQRSDITVKMSNVTRDSAQKVSDQMTAIWNNFADGSHTLEYYADVMTALGAATASSTAEISQGLEKFAAVAETVGLSYEYAASALATITSNTRQSADVVGTALKTLFARIQGLSLGETLDDGTTLTKYSEALAKVGIDIKEQNGELKAMDNILNEMANKWDTLNNDQQVALAQTVAGVRQYTQLIALMENWDNGDEDSMIANLRTSSNAEGALQEQQDIYAESWEAARDRVTAAWESIYNKILDSDFFIKLTNLFADAVNGLDKFIDMAGGLPGILSLIASLTTKIFGPQIAKSLQTLAYNFEVFTGSAEAKANTLRKQAKDAIDDFNKNLDKNSADYLEGEVRKRDIDRSFELQQMKNISDETREYYQTLIDIERQYGENAVAARRATEMASQQIESTETNFKHKIRDANLDPDKVFSGSTTNAVQYNGKTIATTTTPNIQEKFLSFQDIYSGVSQIKTDGRKGSSIDNQLKKVKDLQKLYPELEDARKRFAEAEEKYQKRDKTNAEEGKKLNQERATARAAMVEQIKKAQTQQLSETGAVIKAIQAFKKLHPEIDITTEEFSNYADELQNLINKENQQREAEKNNKDAQKNLNDQFKKGVPALTSYASSIVNVANGISSVIFGLTSMKSAFEALNNTDMSFSEKLGSFFTSFSMSVGSLISGLGGLGQGIKTLSELNIKNFIPSLIGTIAGLDVETQVTGKNTKEKLLNILVAKGWITEEQKATMTAQGLTKALLTQVAAWISLNWWILAIVAAIGLLVAAFVIFQQNTPEKKLEKLTEKAEESKKAADEAKQSYEGLKDTIEGYDGAIQKIEDLTKGTKEFKDAVEEANEKAKELIETYGIASGFYIDENGIIRFEENVLEDAEQKSKDNKNNKAAVDLKNDQAVREEKRIQSIDKEINDYVTAFGTAGLTVTKELNEQNASTLYDFFIKNKNIKTKDENYYKELGNILGINYDPKNNSYMSTILEEFDALQFNDGFVALNSLVTNIGNINSDTISEMNSAAALYGTEAGYFEDTKYNNAINVYASNKDVDFTSKYDDWTTSDLQVELEKMGYKYSNGKWFYQDQELTDFNRDKQVEALAGRDSDADYQTRVGEFQAYSDSYKLDAKVMEAMSTGNWSNFTEDEYNLLQNPQYWNSNSDIIVGQDANGEDIIKSRYSFIEEYAKEAGLTIEEFEAEINAAIKDYNDHRLEYTYAALEQEKQAYQKEAAEVKSIYDTMFKDGVEGLDEQQLAKLDALEAKYSSLAEAGERGSKEYLEALRIIQEANEAYAIGTMMDQEDNLWAQYEKETEKAEKDTEKIQEILDQIVSTNYEIQLAINEDIETDLDNIYNKINQITSAAEKIGEGFTVSADDIREVAEAFPGILKNYKVLANGQIKLDRKVAEAVIDNAQAEIEADKKVALEKIRTQKTEINSRLTILRKMLEIAKKQAKREIDAEEAKNQMAEASAEYKEELANDELTIDKDLHKEKEENLDEFDKQAKESAEYTYNAFRQGSGASSESHIAFINGAIAAMNEFVAAGNAAAAMQTYNSTAKDVGKAAFNWWSYNGNGSSTSGDYSGEVDTGGSKSFSDFLSKEGVNPEDYINEIQDEIDNYEDLLNDLDIQEAELLAQMSGLGGSLDDVGKGEGSSEEMLDPEDEIERYHENARAIERLTRALDKVSTAKDRAFGKHRLALIDDEIEATEKLVGQQRAYIAEAKQYLKQDFAEIQQYGFTTDQYGELTNYDEVMKQQIDKYNAAVATGNQDAIDAAKKQYDEFKENMEQYEETLTLYEEAQAQLQDYINQVVDLKLEKITTEVEIKLRVNDKELTKLEYLLKKIEYEGKGAADAIGLIGKQFEQVNQKAETVREAIDKIYKQAREEGRGFTDEEIAEAQALYEGGLTPEEEVRLQEIHQKVIDEDRALTQAEEDQILEYQEMLLEYNSEVMDYVETVEGKFIETFDELNGAVDETIGRFATYTGMLETLKDVITLTGKANTKYGKDLMSQFSARTVANASAAMRSNIASYNNLNKQYEAQQQSLARAIEAGDERFIQTQKEYLEHVELARETAYEAMLTSWSDVLQASSDLFDARLDEMIFNLKQNLGDIDTLVEIYDRAVELEELYVSGNKSIYELSKLARDIGKDIDATSNLIAKNKLTGLLEQINKLRAEGVKLSEYDLEYWQAKYELELAEIALQEAQEAKSQIKLTRNNAGGWGYMYTADAEAIAEAEQNYEDSLYNMQSIHEEYISDYSERFLKNQQEMADELHNIDKERADYEEEVMRVRDHYFRQQEYLMNELNKAYERSGISFKDTILGQQSEFSTLEQYYQNFIDSSSEMIENEFIDSYKLWQQQIQDANNEMGKNLEDFAENISNTSDTLEDKVISKIDEMGITMEETSNKIWDFQETYGAAIAEMIKANEEFFDKTAKDYNNFISETAIGEYLKNQEAFMSTGDVLGLTGKGGMGATGYGGLGTAGSASSALNGWLGSLNSATGRSSSKSSGSKNSIVLGDGGSEGVHLRADGTYSGIATISAGEERIPEAAMRALREDPALKGMDLSSYGGDDNSLSASELKKLFKDKNVDYSKYTKDNDDVKKFGITLATGGYTGSWGPDGRWALLHEKELVLNKFDTENMLNMVNTLRDIDWRAKIAELWPAIEEKFIMPALNQAEELLQEVHIEANFPGISDRNELEEAFHNLINTASQYANRKRY